MFFLASESCPGRRDQLLAISSVGSITTCRASFRASVFIDFSTRFSRLPLILETGAVQDYCCISLIVLLPDFLYKKCAFFQWNGTKPTFWAPEAHVVSFMSSCKSFVHWFGELANEMKTCFSPNSVDTLRGSYGNIKAFWAGYFFNPLTFFLTLTF